VSVQSVTRSICIFVQKRRAAAVFGQDSYMKVT